MNKKTDHQSSDFLYFEKIELEQFFLSITDIVVKDDNSLMYGGFGIGNADDLELTKSINEKGVLEPLVISVDRVLLSGHRRLAAAMYLDLDKVPVRIVETVYEDLKSADRLKLLQSFNKQRDKTVGERIKEKLLTIDPAKAHQELEAHKEKISRGDGIPLANVHMGLVKKGPVLPLGSSSQRLKRRLILKNFIGH